MERGHLQKAASSSEGSESAPADTIQEKLRSSAQADTGKGARQVYDAKTLEEVPGVKARFEGDAATGNSDVDRAYEYTGIVRDFYKQVLGRNSIDNKGMDIVSTVNFGDGHDNAYWVNEQLVFGKPSEKGPYKTFILLDMAGHELTHGVIDDVAGMKFYGQSGALQEHIADVFGELIQQWSKGTKAKDADWVVAEGTWKPHIKGAGIRNMLNPGTAYDDPKLGVDDQVAHYNRYFRTTLDHGGVHYNSGIPNRAFAMFAIDVGGYAWEKAGKIWYDALHHSGKEPSFAQFAYQTLESAKRLGFTEELPKLEKAWGSVGIQPSATERDTRTPPEQDNPNIKEKKTAQAAEGDENSDNTDQKTKSDERGLAAPTQLDYEGTLNVFPVYSGSVVRFEGSKATDKALVMTNGHAVKEYDIPAGSAIADQPSNLEFKLAPKSGEGATPGYIFSKKLLYATKSQTDLALYQLEESYDSLKTRYGVSPLTISKSEASEGSNIAVVSGRFRYTYNCTVDKIIPRLEESRESYRNAIRYSENCRMTGGVSGSPIIELDSKKIVGIHNTSAGDGAVCSENSPCEVEGEKRTSKKGASYGQQVADLYSCLDDDNTLNFDLKTCKLPKPAN